MRKSGFLVIALAALMVVGSSTAFAASLATDNSTIASPYWQADANGIYTFIGISNPSISGNISRGITVTAMSAANTAGISVTFTISPATTTKVFITNTNHSSVNSATVTGVQWIALTGSGQLVIAGAYGYDTDETLFDNTTGFVDLLSVWGAIVIPSSSTGFAMEFIGDMADSTSDSLTDGLGRFGGM